MDEPQDYSRAIEPPRRAGAFVLALYLVGLLAWVGFYWFAIRPVLNQRVFQFFPHMIPMAGLPILVLLVVRVLLRPKFVAYMPEVDSRRDMIKCVAEARRMSAGLVPIPGESAAARSVAIITPGGLITHVPCPPAGAASPAMIAATRQTTRRET